MMYFILTGVLTAIGFWIILMKLNIRKVLRFEVLIDTVFTLGLVAFFIGTFSGIMTGVIAGITLSVLLAVSKKLFGVDKSALFQRKDKEK